MLKFGFDQSRLNLLILGEFGTTESLSSASSCSVCANYFGYEELP